MSVEFKRRDRYVYRHVAGEHLLVALHGDRTAPLFAFTPTGASIWQRLNEWQSVGQLADYMAERYDVSRDQAVTDVNQFLEQLSSLGALETRDSQ